MKAILNIFNEFINVSIYNDSTVINRIWKPENSWGWNNIQLILKGKMDKEYYIKRSSRDWTYNFPGYNEIPSGGKDLIEININDGWWDIDKGINDLKEDTISLKVLFEIVSTPEAHERLISIVTLESNKVISKPPHKWLFSNH